MSVVRAYCRPPELRMHVCLFDVCIGSAVLRASGARFVECERIPGNSEEGEFSFSPPRPPRLYQIPVGLRCAGGRDGAAAFRPPRARSATPARHE